MISGDKISRKDRIIFFFSSSALLNEKDNGESMERNISNKNDNTRQTPSLASHRESQLIESKELSRASRRTIDSVEAY